MAVSNSVIGRRGLKFKFSYENYARTDGRLGRGRRIREREKGGDDTWFITQIPIQVSYAAQHADAAVKASPFFPSTLVGNSKAGHQL